ncbi:MAG: hypothetical protein LJF15_07100 [Acidobacteria bacterium]|jgi:hypothetical protein|nr:hypothetical protein [Acidobacteriota bacterium]
MRDTLKWRRRWLWPAGAFVLLVAWPPPGLAQEGLALEEQYVLRLEYLWWSPQPQGELQKGLGEAEGTLIDIESDLAVESGRANQLRGAIRLGTSWKLTGGWTPLDFKGDTTAPQPFTYGTLVARFGDRIVTSLKGNYVSTALEWDFVSNEQGFLGGLVGVRYFDVDTVMVNADTSTRVAETEKLPIPVLGLAGRVYFQDWFSLEGELSGITVGSRGHLWEWLLALRVHFTDRLAATGGYHRLSLEGQDDRDFFSLSLGTWTFGVEISL